MTQAQAATQETRTETAAVRGQSTIRKEQGWVTLYSSSQPAHHSVTNHGGISNGGDPIELEVEADGEFVGAIGTGQTTNVEAKKLRIRALCDSITYSHETS